MIILKLTTLLLIRLRFPRVDRELIIETALLLGRPMAFGPPKAAAAKRRKPTIREEIGSIGNMASLVPFLGEQ